MREILKNKKWVYRILTSTFILISLFFIFSNSYKEIYSINKKNEDNAYKLSRIFNIKFEFLNTSIDDIKNTTLFKEYLDAPKDSFYIINNLYKELTKRNNIYGKLGYIISLTKEDSNIVITPQGTKNKKDYYEELGFDLSKINSNMTMLIANNEKDISLLIKNKDLLYQKNTYWIITLEKELYFSELNSSNYDNWFLFYNNLYPLSSITKIIPELKDINQSDILIFSEGYFLFSLLYIKPTINYFSIFIKESIQISFIFGILWILITFILKSLEAPIKDLAKKIGLITGQNNIINNSNSDIDYIEKQFEELNDKKNTLEEQIDHLDSFAKKKLLKDYILGIAELNSLDKIPLESMTNINENNKRICLLEVFDMDSLEDNYDNFIQTKDFIISKLDFFKIEKYITIDYKSIVLIIDDRDNNILEEQLKELLDETENNYSIKFVAAISDLMKNIEDLPKAYRICKKILEYKFIFKPNNILFYYKINKKQLNSYYYPIEIESKLVSKVLNGNALGVKKVVDKIFGEKVEYNKMSKEKVMEFSALLYNTLQRILLQLQEFYGDKKIIDINIDKIYRINDIYNLKESFLSILLDICKITKTEDQNDVDIVQLKIKTYLEENYSKDLSLENLADYLGHSFKYTSILFKKVMGDNFKNYLNLYRIKRAKELMYNDKSLKIKDIASLVGCNSSNTFIRIFRKYEGVSPTQYLSENEEFEIENI